MTSRTGVTNEHTCKLEPVHAVSCRENVCCCSKLFLCVFKIVILWQFFVFIMVLCYCLMLWLNYCTIVALL